MRYADPENERLAAASGIVRACLVCMVVILLVSLLAM